MSGVGEVIRIDVKWRIGRKCGYNVYAQQGAEPADGDPPLFMAPNDATARHIVRLHNNWLERQ